MSPHGILMFDAMVNPDGPIREVYAPSGRRKPRLLFDPDNTASMQRKSGSSIAVIGAIAAAAETGGVIRIPQ